MTAWTERIPLWLRNAARPAYPLYRAVALWSDAGGMRMSAAMSFYGILSLAPLLILIVALFGWWIDPAELQRGLVAQIGSLVGEQGGALIQGALASAKEPAQGVTASVIGFAVLLFGATGVFGELQEAFERLWRHGSAEAPEQKWWHGASLQLRGVAYVLAFGFLMLVSLAISTLLNLFSGRLGGAAALEPLLRLASEVLAFALCTGLFVALMRISHGPKPRARYLVLGGVVGATLFTVGRQLLAAYLSSAAVVSAYGAAGSMIVMLMWIYFSSAVLLFAASCAKALEEERRRSEAAARAAGVAPRPADGGGVR